MRFFVNNSSKIPKLTRLSYHRLSANLIDAYSRKAFIWKKISNCKVRIMLETIALIVLSVSILVFLYSLTALRKPSYSGAGAGKQQSTPSHPPTPTTRDMKRAKIMDSYS